MGNSKRKAKLFPKVALGVFTAHFLVFITLLISKKPPFKSNKIIVSSSIIQKKQVKQNSKPISKLKPPSLKKNIPNKKKIVKVQNSFTKDLKNCFKNLSKKSTKPTINSANLSIPKKITKLNAPTISLDNMTADFYEEKLIAYLQDNLELPEIGAVKVEVTINVNGIIEKLTFLNSENSENVKYLKNQLHRLIYPCFNCNDLEQPTKSYIINFNSLK